MATVKVIVHEAFGLPVMDRTSNLCDPYVWIKFDDAQERSATVRGTRNPCFNKVFRFDVANLQTLQEDPLEVRVYDYDKFSMDDLVGTVFIDLNCLLPQGQQPCLEAWFPLMDPIEGLHGEIHLTVRVKFHATINPFMPIVPIVPNDSCDADALTEARRLVVPRGTGRAHSLISDLEAVVFWAASRVDPARFRVLNVYGLVEELLFNHDPEQARAAYLNPTKKTLEARSVQLFKLSGKVRRQLTRKVLELGCNAVLGYRENFDFDEANGIVVRATGTPCVLVQVEGNHLQTRAPRVSYAPIDSRDHSSDKSDSASPTTTDSDDDLPVDAEQRQMEFLKDTTKLSRYQVSIVTLRDLPLGCTKLVGGTVCARSVKLITKHKSKAAVMQERDQWWMELRDELRANARAMSCNCIIAYAENAQALDDVVVMSVAGTAVVVDERWTSLQLSPAELVQIAHQRVKERRVCRVVHSPFGAENLAAALHRDLCGACGREYVPDVLLVTCQLPQDLMTDTRRVPKLVEVRVVKERPTVRGHAAQAIAQALPFVEYALHRQLIFRLKLEGFNCAAGFSVSLAFNDDVIIATAVATGHFCPWLRDPAPPRIAITEERILAEPTVHQMNSMWKSLREASTATPRIAASVEATPATSLTASFTLPPRADSPGGETMRSETDATTASRNEFVLQIDDVEDAELAVGMCACASDALVSSVMAPPSHNPHGSDAVANVVMLRSFGAPSGGVSCSFASQCGAEVRQAVSALVLATSVRESAPCTFVGYKSETGFVGDGDVLVRVSGMILAHRSSAAVAQAESDFADALCIAEATRHDADGDGPVKDEPAPVDHLDLMRFALAPFTLPAAADTEDVRDKGSDGGLLPMTPLSFFPRRRVELFRGRVSQHFVRQSHKNSRNAGSFWGSTLVDAESSIAALVRAIGGNALVDYRVIHHEIEQLDGGTQGVFFSITGNAVVLDDV